MSESGKDGALQPYSYNNAVHTSQPGAYTHQPGAYSQQPGVYTQQPGVYTQPLAVYTQQPGSYPGDSKTVPFVNQPDSTLYQPGGQVTMHPGVFPPQQQQEQWMEIPSVPGCPPGLEYLTQIDQIVVKQQIELLEVVTGWETNNKYRVFNKVGQQIYFAAEDSTCFQRQCCGPGRGFKIHIMDNMNKIVMTIVREFKCCAGCCWCAGSDCCAHLATVLDKEGEVLGYVRQAQSGWSPKYTIMTPENDTVAHINGPCCICNSPCCGDIRFPVSGPDQQTEIGLIAKHWSGWAQELFTDAVNFSISFPMDMEVKMKATFMGALFLIDFMYFEKKNNDN